MASGTLRFATIDRLPEGWERDPDSVWTVWDRNTYYLWGANTGNMNLPEGASLQGGGMAGVAHGPTRGLAHPHYVGIDTMSDSTANNAQFTKLRTWLDRGNDVVVPTYHGKYSLGTGIAGGTDHETWRRIQLSIMQGIVTLADAARHVSIPDGTFWPDCRVQLDVGGIEVSICDPSVSDRLGPESDGAHPIDDADSLRAIVTLLGG